MSEARAVPQGLQRHLLLVEPDERLRGLLRGWLSRHGCLVTAARDAGHARRLLEGLDFDLVVAPAASASELAMAGRAPLLALAAGPEEAAAARDAGARAVLARPFAPEELLAMIEQLVPREDAAGPEEQAIRLGSARFDPVTRELRRNGALLRLTAAETRLMERLAAAAGAPVRRESLIDGMGRSLEAAGRDARRSEQDARAQLRAVDVQITRLRRKLEPDPKNPRYILTVRGVGYMLVPD